MPLILLAVALPVLIVIAIPLSLIQRYRVGKARRTARGWVTTLNVVIIALSTGLFLWAAALTSLWVPEAFSYSILGLAGGGILGVLGLALTQWEASPRRLHYTPNRWLILILTLTVTARLLYGFWRGWQAWSAAKSETSWLAASGAAGSLAVGAIVLGYYLTYSAGVWRRLRHYRRNYER